MSGKCDHFDGRILFLMFLVLTKGIDCLFYFVELNELTHSVSY